MKNQLKRSVATLLFLAMLSTIIPIDSFAYTGYIDEIDTVKIENDTSEIGDVYKDINNKTILKIYVLSKYLQVRDLYITAKYHYLKHSI